MKTIQTIAELRQQRRLWREQNKVVGFVPTMGNLHRGHLTLVDYARQTCDVVVVSVFVNPLQFGQNEDLATYPRTLPEDTQQLIAHGADVLFLPTVDEMYPRGLNEQTFVEVPGISAMICGASRPGHFRGVATVVNKLFNMVAPDRAFFGQKDYQQLQVIRLMAQDLSLDIDIQGVPTQRAEDGLALSSRNGYLSAKERAIAPRLHHIMQTLAGQLAQGQREFDALCADSVQQLTEAGFRPDYVEIRRADTLAEPDTETTRLVILIAAYLGKTRLIDNQVVDCPQI